MPDIEKHSLTHSISFLRSCRHEKDIEGVEPTHLSFGDIIQGRFFISNDKHEEFMNLYCQAIKCHSLTILEIPTE